MVAAVVWIAPFSRQEPHVALIKVGSTYTVDGTDFPTDFSQSATLDQTTKLINGEQLKLSETIRPAGSNAEWLEFNFTSANGRPLAGNLQALWGVKISDLTFTRPVACDKGFILWTEKGTPFSITPIGTPATGFAVIPNPINPAAGPVFALPAAIFPTRGDLVIPIEYGVGFGTYTSQLTPHGVNPLSADGFHLALHFTGENFPLGFRPSPPRKHKIRDAEGYFSVAAGNPTRALD